MKRLSLFLAVLIGFGAAGFSQDPDTSKVRIGKKEYTIIINDGEKIKILTEDDSEDVVVHEHVYKKKKMRRMDGIWDGLEIGVNNFLNYDNELALPANGEFMDLKVPNSWGVNLNFAEKSFGLIGNYFGVVTGLGFEYNRYMLTNDVNVDEVNGFMTGVPLDIDLDKNRLSVCYLNVPLLVEIQLPITGESKRIHLSGGIIGGMRLYSRQVQKYTIDGEKQKNKTKDGFNLRDFRYGFTARVGYGDFAFFANYYPQSLFAEGMGPDIFPVTVGIHLGGE